MYKGTIEDVIRKMYQTEKKLDAVNPVAVKKKFDDRKDKDIDNDGDVDSSDKFLHNHLTSIWILNFNHFNICFSNYIFTFCFLSN